MKLNSEIISWKLRDAGRLAIKTEALESESEAQPASPSQPFLNQIESTNLPKEPEMAVNDRSILNVSSTPQAMVDGVAVDPNLSRFITEDGTVINIHANWHLRKQRADIYLSPTSKVDYLPALKEFLAKFKLKILAYEPQYHYLPSDILLLDEKDKVEQGTVIYLQQGKRAVWQFLKSNLPEVFAHV